MFNLSQVGRSMSNKGSFIGEWGVLTMIVAKMTKQKDGGLDNYEKQANYVSQLSKLRNIAASFIKLVKAKTWGKLPFSTNGAFFLKF